MSFCFFHLPDDHQTVTGEAHVNICRHFTFLPHSGSSVIVLISELFSYRRMRHQNSAYKRVSSRDHLNVQEKEEILGRLQSGIDKETGRPSWKRPLPHIMVAALSSFLYGYHLGVVNDTLETIAMELGFSGNTFAEGLVVSACLGGAFVGSLFSGWIVDGVGRRRAFQICALPMIIGASTSANANSLEGLLLGRLFVGAGMGIGPPVAALYVSEVSPASIRGTFGSSTQIASCLGLLGSLFIGIPAKENEGWWRICFWVSVIPATLLALFMEFCAESPHWLFKKGRSDEAEAEFERLLGVLHVKTAMAELSKLDRGDDIDTFKYSELLHGHHSRVVFLGSALFALQQLSGINAIFCFSSTVFNNVGVPSDLANMCVGIVNLSGSIVAMVLMDRLGRKVLLLGSFLGMAASMGIQVIAASAIFSGYIALYLSVGGMLLFVLMFSLGAGPVPGLLLSEILPRRIKEKAMAGCLTVHWVINFFLGLFFLSLLEQLGPQILYTLFATFCLIAVVFVRHNVVETKGKTLQEIETLIN